MKSHKSIAPAISISNVKNALPGMTIFDPATNNMWVFDGQAWQPVNVDSPIPCVVCGRLVHEVENVNGALLIPDHPFCGDNLQYLEWQVEKRERSASR